MFTIHDAKNGLSPVTTGVEPRPFSSNSFALNPLRYQSAYSNNMNYHKCQSSQYILFPHAHVTVTISGLKVMTSPPPTITHPQFSVTPAIKPPHSLETQLLQSKMTPSQQNFILQTIAYPIPLLLVAVLVYSDGNNSKIIVNTLVQKMELNPGLKALELVMNVSFMASN